MGGLQYSVEERRARGADERRVGSAAVDSLDVTVCKVPTDEPESDGSLEWEATTIVIVRARAAGVTGVGYTYADEATAIVVLEPSTVAVFREEMPDLLPKDEDVRRLSENSYLLSEFLMKEEVKIPKLRRTVLAHGHCHQKTVLDFGCMKRALHQMEVETTMPEEGCCGMAGAFGFEADHYDVSMTIGELRLLPAVREAAPDTLIVSEGFSCRAQIEENTGRQVLHFADLVALAFEEQP